MIKAISFDLWNTLIEVKTYRDQRMAFLEELLRKRGYSPKKDTFLDVYEKVNNFGHDYAESAKFKHIHTKTRIKNMLEFLKYELDEEEIEHVRKYFENVLVEDPPPLKQDAKAVVEELSEQYPLVIISDTGITPGKNLRKMLAKYEILDYFDHTTFSDETGYFKPHEHNFHHTLTLLKRKAHEVVHIGDILQTDVLGAKKAGMKSIWVRSMEYYRDGSEHEIRPDHIVENLKEVPQVIKEL